MYKKFHNFISTIRSIVNDKRRSPANGSNTSSVGGVTSLILLGVVMCGIVLQCNTSDTSAATISMSIDANSLSLDILPRSMNGTFAASSNSIGVDVTLTGTGGYTFGIKAATIGTNATKLVNATDNTKTLNSITTATTLEDFSADTAEAGETYNNTWGYLPSKYNSIDNTTTNYYYPAPSTAGDILDHNETTDATGHYTISIAARAAADTTIGSYTNTFTLIAIANIDKVCNPFAQNITEAICMQDINETVIDTMVTNQQYSKVDERDEKTYYIAKLADGKVWMTQNLDLDLETTPTNVLALTSENTDLNTFGSQNYTTANGYTCTNTDTSITTTTASCTGPDEVITWTPIESTSSTAADWGTDNSTLPRSFDYGTRYRYTSDNNNIDTAYASLDACKSAKGENAGCEHYHVGNYYNFTAAVASNTTNGINTDYTAMSNSICPSGWKLPEGRNADFAYNDVTYLWTKAGITKNFMPANVPATWDTNGFNNLRTAPFYFVRAGYKTDTGNPSNIGTEGRFWSNRIYNSSNALQTLVYYYNPYPGANVSRGYGVAVRCVARQDNNTGTTTITFNKNNENATGEMTNQAITANTVATLTPNTYSLSGYGFTGWNTEANGTGTSFTDVAEFYAAAGDINTNITLYAQWAQNKTITFNKNDEAATGTMSDQIIAGGASTPLTLNAYTNTGKILGSWNTAADGSGTSYGNGGMYTVPVDSTGGTVTLYAQWITNICNPNGTTIGTGTSTDIKCMQDISSTNKDAILGLMTQGTQYQLIDNRDNKQYYIAKQADGNIWMTQNLDLDIGYTALTSNNTDLTVSGTNIYTDGYTNEGGVITWTPATTAISSNKVITNPASPSAFNGWINDYNKPYSADGGNYYYYTSNSTSGDTTYNSLAACIAAKGADAGCEHYHAGNYYNWTAAIASNTSNNVTAQYTVTDNSVCPAGWRLPKGQSSSTSSATTREFGQLLYASGVTDRLASSGAHYTADGFNKMRTDPLFFVRGGNIYGSSFLYAASGGYYWSSTVSSSYNAYRLDFNSSNVNSASNNTRALGFPVRCVVR